MVMRKIKLNRGKLANLPQLELGEPAVATDDGSLHIGTEQGNVKLAKDADVQAVSQQLADKAERNEVVIKGEGDLNDFNEPTRAILQGLETGEINAVLGEKNVKSFNIDDRAVTIVKTDFITTGKNLIDKSGNVFGERVNFYTGSGTTSLNWQRTDFAYVKPSKSYTFTSFGETSLSPLVSMVNGAVYDKDGNFISGIDSATSLGGSYVGSRFKLDPLPANAHAVRFSINYHTRVMQLEEGEGSEYEDYYIKLSKGKTFSESGSEVDLSGIESSIADLQNDKAEKTYVDDRVSGINVFRKYGKFSPDDINGYYNTHLTNHSDFSADPSVTSVNDYYAALNALVADHPDYITSVNLGKDSSGLYDVYEYRLTPKEPQTSIGQPLRLPKIVIIGGQHGDEKSSIFSLYYFVKDLLENWEDDNILEYLRFNCRFVIVPCLNPYGFMNGTRENANGVDINRNYDYLWDAETSPNKGSAPLSEIESQYVKKIIDDNWDAVHLVDYHTNNSSGDVYYNLNAIIMPSLALNNYDLNIAGYYHVKKVSREFAKSYDPAGADEFFGYQSRGDNCTLKCYSAYRGITSATFEGFRKFPSESEYYTENTIKANTENVVNWLADLIRHFRMETKEITKA